MLTRDTQVRPAVNAYTMTMGGLGAGPWPDTFLYYDKECQLAFIEGECTPRMFRNYIGKHQMNDEFNESVPQVFINKYEKDANRISLVYQIGYWPPVPFGLAYWDELDGYKVETCPEDVEVKMIGGKLAFLRFKLTGQPRELALELVKSKQV